MKGTQLFVMSMLASFCLVRAGRVVDADSSGTEAAPRNVAVIGDCAVAGELVRRDDGIYAVLTVENPSDTVQTPTFHYVVTCRPGANPMSRMMPMQRTVKAGSVSLSVAAGSKETEEILVMANIVVHPATDTAPKLRVISTTPDVWMLTASPNPPEAPAAGAAVPAALAGMVTLREGQVTLARFVDAPAVQGTAAEK